MIMVWIAVGSREKTLRVMEILMIFLASAAVMGIAERLFANRMIPIDAIYLKPCNLPQRCDKLQLHVIPKPFVKMQYIHTEPLQYHNAPHDNGHGRTYHIHIWHPCISGKGAGVRERKKTDWMLVDWFVAGYFICVLISYLCAADRQASFLKADKPPALKANKYLQSRLWPGRKKFSALLHIFFCNFGLM